MKNHKAIGPATAAALAVLAAAGALVRPPAAQAFPKFSTKEKKPCSYCHVNPAGGGPRNAAGKWYKEHGLSFAGYTPQAAASPAAKPSAKPSPAAKKPSPAPKKPAPKKPAGKKG
jgi:hypothetical protein